MIVKASIDTGACYGVKKCAEVVFRRGKMIKGEGLTVLEEKMEALDPEKNEIYVMNVCNLGKGQLDELDKIVKSVLRREGFHGRQSSDEQLYLKRKEGGRGLKSFKEVYDKTKARVACHMASSTNEWIKSKHR